MQLVTTVQLAQILNVHTNTVRRWVKEDRIPRIKISETDFRFDVEKVIAALEEQNK